MTTDPGIWRAPALVLALACAVGACGRSPASSDPGAAPDAAPAADAPADLATGDSDLADAGLADSSADQAAQDADAPAGQDAAEDAGAADAPDATADATADTAAPPPGPIDPESLPLAAFADVTLDYGIEPGKTHSICVAAADLDGNGREDLVMVERAGTSAKIHAVLLGEGAPAHVWTPFDTTLLLPTTGCSLVDMDDDGAPDLLVGGQSGAALYLGDGKGGFVDASEQWLPYIMDFAAWSIAPVDLDGDGDLDLFVGAGSPSFDASNPGPGPACGSQKCGYEGTDFVCELVTKDPNIAEAQDRVLIRGAKLPLEDQTEAWQVPPAGILSAALPVDIDADGKMDVLVTDDFGGHRLLHNLGGKFAVHDTSIGFYPYAHGMGWGMGDFDGDGLADLVMADVGPSPLYVQTKPGPGQPAAFADQGGQLGIWGPSWSASIWSPMVADFDHDGQEDIMVGSALNTTPADLPAVTAGCTKGTQLPYGGLPNIDILFLAQPGGGFLAQRFPTGPESHFMAIAQAVLDLDGDGDLDVLQSRPNGDLTSRVRVLRNDMAKAGGSLRVVVTGKKGNRDALGTVVTAQIGGKLRTRWLSGGGGFGGNRSRIAHFGLGSAAAATDVTITWPDGKKTVLGDVPAGATKTATWP